MGFIARASVVLALVALAGLTGCGVAGIPGSGKKATVAREVASFDRIAIAGAGTIEIVVGGETQSIEIETDDNLIELVQTEVVDGKLTIKFSESASPTNGLNAKIQIANLKELDVAGAYTVSLQVKDEPSLAFKTAGSVKVSGSGKADELTINAAGSGTFEFAELVALKVKIDAAGSTQATINAAESLDVNIAGSGTVKYSGEPKVNQRIVGSGTVEKIELKVD